MDPPPTDAPFVHLRHKPTLELPAECELVLAIPQLKSNINLSRIARAAGCSGVKRIIVEGKAKIDPKIARDAAKTIQFEHRRSLAPALRKEIDQGYSLVGLEQTTHSSLIFDFEFPAKTVLVVGHERTGLTPDLLALLQATVEIPVFGLPYSYNVATATSMALYEYNRQFYLKERLAAKRSD